MIVRVPELTVRPARSPPAKVRPLISPSVETVSENLIADPLPPASIIVFATILGSFGLDEVSITPLDISMRS